MVRNLLIHHNFDQAHLTSLVRRAVPTTLRDDRFGDWERQLSTPGHNFIGCGLRVREDNSENQLIGYLGGFQQGAELHLDLLIDQTEQQPIIIAKQLLDAIEPAVSSSGATSIHVWTKPHSGWHDLLAEQAGLVLDRTLFQMRATLPTSLKPLTTRSFVPGQDNEALREINNRAFASHPDQGNQSSEDFNAALSQSWVNAEGIRLHEIDGRLAGFCWTKIHEQPPLGEIYVIGVHPDFHGQGLGKAMTAAGLVWLHSQGQKTSMLYVEGDNYPAIATYKGLGFETVRTDKSWTWLPARFS